MRRSVEAVVVGAAMVLVSGALNQVASQETACSLLTRAEAADILGKPAIANATIIADDQEECSYLGSGFDLHTEVLSSPSGWSASRAELIKQGKAEAVDGLADEAAFTTDGNGDYVLVARKGNRIVTVTMYASEGSAAELKPQMVELVKTAVSRVPQDGEAS